MQAYRTSLCRSAEITAPDLPMWAPRALGQRGGAGPQKNRGPLFVTAELTKKIDGGGSLGCGGPWPGPRRPTLKSGAARLSVTALRGACELFSITSG